MKWTDEAINFLLKNYPVHGAKYCAEQLGVAVTAITRKTSRLGLVSPNNVVTRKAAAQAKGVALWPREDAAIDRAFNAWRHPVEPAQLTWRIA